ncbi:hypothetical protein ACW73L_15485 [Methylolobus aquaticus]
MHDLDASVRKAEKNLNDALRHFEAARGGLDQEFVELKLQACIFQYDVCAEMVSVIRNQPSGFASSVALKGLVLRLFEYDLVLNKHLIPRMLALAKKRGIPVGREDLRARRQKWKSELRQLQDWSSVRNQAAGHYCTDIQSQVSLLKCLNVDGVMTVTRAFLSFNMDILVMLRDAGMGHGA